MRRLFRTALWTSSSGFVCAQTLSMKMRRFMATATDSSVPRENVRNLAVIAHVDHGKTTLVDCLLRQSNTKIAANEQRVMDHNALEKERGITILSKCTSIVWRDPKSEENYQINLIDTPGHADFGEVERIMSMVEGVVLVVDATEGPMTQTKFVLGKALKAGVKPLVVFNKVDRPTNRVGEVENDVFDLFINLNATEEQLEYSVVYASARDGWSSLLPKEVGKDMIPLFSTIVKTVPRPRVELEKPFSMLVTQIEIDQFFGKLLLGRVSSGSVKTGDRLHALDPQSKKIEEVKVLKILCRRGLDQIIVDEAVAGDVISVAGFGVATVNSTLCDVSVSEPIPSVPIDPPTLGMEFGANDSPFSGKDGGSKLTSGAIKERLQKEGESNVSISVLPGTGDSLEVRGRGELQLGVLIETMRREGFELSISAPRVVFRNEDGVLEEPLEEVLIEVPDEYAGMIIEKLSRCKGELKEYVQNENGKSKLSFVVPMRSLIGYRSELANDTKGQAVMNTLFYGWVPHLGDFDRSEKGALISMAEGKATAFSLEQLQERGPLFIKPGDDVYSGMVVGENSRGDDMEVNPAKQKALTNVRSTSKEDAVKLTPPRIMSLEDVIAYARDDEKIEVTPKHIRLRKIILDASERSRLMRVKAAKKRTAG